MLFFFLLSQNAHRLLPLFPNLFRCVFSEFTAGGIFLPALQAMLQTLVKITAGLMGFKKQS